MLVAGAGLLVAATGTLAMAWSPWAGLAVIGALVQGVGTALFTSRVGPVLLGSAPRTHLARVQSLLVLVQAAPLVVAMPLLGSLAAWAGVGATTTTCAVGGGHSRRGAAAAAVAGELRLSARAGPPRRAW